MLNGGKARIARQTRNATKLYRYRGRFRATLPKQALQTRGRYVFCWSLYSREFEVSPLRWEVVKSTSLSMLSVRTQEIVRTLLSSILTLSLTDSIR